MHGYFGKQNEKGRYHRPQMSATVGKGLFGVRSPTGIEWDRSRSIGMAIEVGWKKKADITPGTGRYPVDSGRALLESARVGTGHIGIQLSPEGPDWNPLA